MTKIFMQILYANYPSLLLVPTWAKYMHSK